MAHLLIIDDDRDFGQALQSLLEDHRHCVEYVESPQDGLAYVTGNRFDVVLLDNRMPGMTGIEFLKVLQEQNILTPVILMTNRGTSETVMEAMNLGAFDYVEKPLELEPFIHELEPLLKLALELAPEKPLSAPPPPSGPSDLMLGKSKPMLELFKQIGKVAGTDLPVLIRGETGTGKDLVARAIRDFSPRKSKPFVALNCAALNEELLESELFGHEPGAFTNATKLRKGRFEYASSGTIFLDEVGDMPPSVQVKLLRVLENQQFERVGGNDTITTDVRILSATHQNLEAAVNEGRFREDLFFRLNGVTLSVPPLRERGADVERLARHFLGDEAGNAKRPIPTLHESTLRRIGEYEWPGNVRQLQFVMRRAVQKCRGMQILPADLDLPSTNCEEQAGTNSAGDLQQIVASLWSTQREQLWPTLSEMFERELIEHALAKCQGNKREVARRLGVSPNYLLKRIRALSPLGTGELE